LLSVNKVGEDTDLGREADKLVALYDVVVSE
jgi:hypothetical protein